MKAKWIFEIEGAGAYKVLTPLFNDDRQCFAILPSQRLHAHACTEPAPCMQIRDPKA